MAESPVDLPETATIPTTAIERLAYAGGRVADEVAELRETVDKLSALVAPALEEYRLELVYRRDARTEFNKTKAAYWVALRNPVVVAAIIGALLTGLGFRDLANRITPAPATTSTSIEVHDAP